MQRTRRETSDGVSKAENKCRSRPTYGEADNNNRINRNAK